MPGNTGYTVPTSVPVGYPQTHPVQVYPLEPQVYSTNPQVYPIYTTSNGAYYPVVLQSEDTPQIGTRTTLSADGTQKLTTRKKGDDKKTGLSDTGKLVLGLGAGYLLYNHIKNQNRPQYPQYQQPYYHQQPYYPQPPRPHYQYQQPQPTFTNYPSYAQTPSFQSSGNFGSGVGAVYGRTEPRTGTPEDQTNVGDERIIIRIPYYTNEVPKRTKRDLTEPKDVRITYYALPGLPALPALPALPNPYASFQNPPVFQEEAEGRQARKKTPTGALLVAGLGTLAILNAAKPNLQPQYQQNYYAPPQPMPPRPVYQQNYYQQSHVYPSYPTNSYPTNSFPTNSFPTNSFPTNSFPTNSFPTNSFPTNSFPTNSFPTNSYPKTSYPTTSYPTTSYPNTNNFHNPSGTRTSLIGASDGGAKFHS